MISIEEIIPNLLTPPPLLSSPNSIKCFQSTKLRLLSPANDLCTPIRLTGQRPFDSYVNLSIICPVTFYHVPDDLFLGSLYLPLSHLCICFSLCGPPLIQPPLPERCERNAGLPSRRVTRINDAIFVFSSTGVNHNPKNAPFKIIFANFQVQHLPL